MDSNFISFFSIFPIRYIKGLKQPEDIWVNINDLMNILGYYDNYHKIIDHIVLSNEIIEIDTRVYQDQYLDNENYILKLAATGLFNDIKPFPIFFPKYLNSKYNPIMYYIHEFAAYRLIAKSDKPRAREFSIWFDDMIRSAF